MKNYHVMLEEVITGEYDIYAESLEDALEQLSEMYIRGELVFSDYPVVTEARVMSMDGSIIEQIEW